MANTYQNIDLTQLFDASVSQDAIKDIYTVSKEIVDLIRKNYLNEEMSPQGKLANFDSVISYDGNLYQLQLTLPPEWYWVEFGRRPSQKMPPVDKIEEWVKNNLGTKKLVPKGSKDIKRNPKQIAFAIAKKIQKEGFYSPNHHGLHIIEKSLNEADQLITKLCNLITEKLNIKVRQDIVSVFEGLNSFKTK